MKNIKIFIYSFIHFFLSGFVVLLLVNLALRKLVWVFFVDTWDISILNLIIVLSAMVANIKLSAKFYLEKIRQPKRKLFIILASFFLFLAEAGTSIYSLVQFDVEWQKIIVQLINAVIIVLAFYFFSFRYIAKKVVKR